MFIANELGCKVRLEVVLETVYCILLLYKIQRELQIGNVNNVVIY